MNIPTILSGPILRRAEASQVFIWLATSQPFSIDAELYLTTDTNYERIPSKTYTETIRMGQKLFVYLVEITPKHRSFPTNQLLGYNLFFSDNTKVLDLESFGLLSPENPHALIYGDNQYPTFFINNDNNNNHVLYGSCRKIHGKGDDALVSADMKLEENYHDVQRRPSNLFLMGDQIYADDVGDPLILFIKKLSKELIGVREQLESLDDRLSIDPFPKALNQIHGRQFIMKHFAKFTSNNASNHLIEFGEYAVMYLLSWGPQLWDLAKEFGVFEKVEQKLKSDQYYFVYPEDPCFQEERKKELENHQSRYREQVQDIYRFQQTLFRVRRVMASTPTYMIFDDHDVTDDWNLTIDWKNNVRGSSLGRHVITNALAAYWAFQAWGNDPHSFSTDFKNKIATYFKGIDVKSPAYQDLVDLLWSYDHWYFVTPTKPKALFLDTRTLRGYDPLPRPTSIGSTIEENINSPRLISKDAWINISRHLKRSQWRSEDQLMIVSPSPLYGIGLIESFLQNYIYPLRTLGISVESLIDFEAWKYNGEGFNEFLQWIAKWNPRNCFILSGDVHYASAVKSTVTFASGKKTTIHQFTSSPMNNMSFSGLWGFLMKRVIGLNSLQRKEKTINRYCDGPCNLVIEDETNACPDDYQWRESINYLSTNKNSLIATDNNIGLLSIDSDSVQNHLLNYYGLYMLEESFDELPLE